MKTYDIKINYLLREDAVPWLICNRADRVAEYMKGAFDEYPLQESFWVIPLNRKNYPLGRHMVTLGTATAALAHPVEILRVCILAGATGAVCVHNHPSGDPAPSAADLTITQRLREGFKAVGIEFLDHVIIGSPGQDPVGRGFYSFREAGLI